MKLTPLRLWFSMFTLWGLLLSGVFASFVGSPGIIQALRLKSLLSSKEEHLARVHQEVRRLRADAIQLEHSKVAQQREIRRVLGYTASDEIIFDFTTHADSI